MLDADLFVLFLKGNKMDSPLINKAGAGSSKALCLHRSPSPAVTQLHTLCSLFFLVFIYIYNIFCGVWGCHPLALHSGPCWVPGVQLWLSICKANALLAVRLFVQSDSPLSMDAPLYVLNVCADKSFSCCFCG